MIIIAGGRLEARERLWLTYGAGAAGARVDRFAESRSEPEFTEVTP